jgi:hypothetical protein
MSVEINHAGMGAAYLKSHPEVPIAHEIGEPCGYCDRTTDDTRPLLPYCSPEVNAAGYARPWCEAHHRHLDVCRAEAEEAITAERARHAALVEPLKQEVATLRAHIANRNADHAALVAALEIIAAKPEPGYNASAIAVSARNIARAALDGEPHG